MNSVSAVVPIYFQEDGRRIKKIVQCLLTSQYALEKIILVVNGSAGDSEALRTTRRIARENYYVKVLHVEKPCVINARKKGMESVLSEYVVFVDVDCTPCDTWVGQLVTSLQNQQEKYKNIFLVSGPAYFVGMDARASQKLVRQQKFLVATISSFCGCPMKKGCGVFITEAGFLAERKVLSQVGFDTSGTGSFGEGANLSAHAKKAGYTVYYDSTIQIPTSARRVEKPMQRYVHAMMLILLYKCHRIQEKCLIRIAFKPTKEV